MLLMINSLYTLISKGQDLTLEHSFREPNGYCADGITTLMIPQSN